MMDSIQLNVGIVGAGVAGFAAAIALRRAGHNVWVYERGDSNSEVGAAIMMPPHAGSILKSWSFNVEEAAGTILAKNRMLNANTGKLVVSEDLDIIDPTYGAPFISYYRADLQRELANRASDAGAHILFSHNVVDVDCTTGQIHFADGTSQNADLIIIANGVYSGFAQKVSGSKFMTRKSGYSCYRSLVSIESLEKSGDHAQLLKAMEVRNGRIEAMCGGMDSERRTLCVIYPCRDGKWLNVAVIHPSASRENDVERWNSPAKVEDAVSALQGFHPMFRNVVRAFSEVRCYSLAVREPIEKLVRDKAILIGDAAHPMLPLHAGGGSCAIEDAATLENILANLQNKEELDTRLQLWQAVRLPRNSVIQILSNNRFFRSDHSTSGVADLIHPFYETPLPTVLPPGWSRPTRGFFCSYNAFDAAERVLAWSKEDGSLAKLLETGKIPEAVVKHFGDEYVLPSEDEAARNQTLRPWKVGFSSISWIRYVVDMSRWRHSVSG